VWAAWWQEKQVEVVDRSLCRVVAHNRSLHAGFEAVHHKTGRVTWLSHKTKTEGSRAERDRGAPRSFEVEDTHRDRKACVEATRRAVAGHLSDGDTKTYSQSALGECVS
jgi:hypothetical protein